MNSKRNKKERLTNVALISLPILSIAITLIPILAIGCILSILYLSFIINKEWDPYSFYAKTVIKSQYLGMDYYYNNYRKYRIIQFSIFILNLIAFFIGLCLIPFFMLILSGNPPLDFRWGFSELLLFLSVIYIFFYWLTLKRIIDTKKF